MAEHELHHRQRQLVDLVAVGSHLTVITEPGSHLVGVGDTAHPGQQRDIEDVGLGLVIQPRHTRESGSQNRLTEYVLLGEAESEVDGQRKRGDQLRQPQRLVAHGRKRTP